MNPRYPVYLPSKGRWQPDRALTAKALARDDVPFFLVVEEQEAAEYAAAWGAERLLILPFQDQGLIAARNWIKDHSIAAGAERHWQLDDNIIEFRRLFRGRRIPCEAGMALRVVEDFSDRYENVAVSGLNYQMFVTAATKVPYYLNVHVYSCSLILNAIPHRWRLVYNDDTDLCLQVLADGWCTVLVNVFMANKIRTMVVSGGNTDALYQGDGRLRMARALERVWPYTVTTQRRFGRPQHVIRDSWRKFDTPLKPKPGFNRADLDPDAYAMKLIAQKDVKSATLRRAVED